MKGTDLMHMEDDGILMYELYWLICTFCKKRKWAGFNLKVQYLFYIPYYTLYTHFTPTILTIGDQPSDAAGSAVDVERRQTPPSIVGVHDEDGGTRGRRQEEANAEAVGKDQVPL